MMPVTAPPCPAGQDGHRRQDDAGEGEAQDELVDSQRTEEYGQHARGDPLAGILVLAGEARRVVLRWLPRT